MLKSAVTSVAGCELLTAALVLSLSENKQKFRKVFYRPMCPNVHFLAVFWRKIKVLHRF